MKKVCILLSVVFVTAMLMLVSCENDKKSVEAFVAEGSELFSQYRDGENLSVEARDETIAFVYTYTSNPETEYERQQIAERLNETFSQDVMYRLYETMKSECPDVSKVVVEYYVPDGEKLVSYEYPDNQNKYIDIVAQICYNNLVNQKVV